MPRKNTVTPRFTLAKYTGSKPQTIYLKLEWNKKRLEYSLKESISPLHWDKKRGTVKGTANSSLQDHVKKLIDRTQSKLTNTTQLVEEIFYEHGQDISKQEVKAILNEKLRGIGGKPRTLFQYFPYYIDRNRSKGKIQPNTLKSYQTIWKRLQNFAKDRKAEFDFNDITEDWREEFVEWHEEKDYAPNSIAKSISTLLAVIENARTKGLHNNLEYQAKGFRMPYSPSFNMRLNFAELNHLMRLELPEHQERVRDAFVLSCYTGLRHGDMVEIQPRNYKKRKSGDVLEITANKTGQKLNIPLKPIATKILKKYGFHSPSTISVQKYNKQLKEIGKAAGFTDELVVKTKGKEYKREKWREMKSHVARRSFATNFYEEDYPIKTLMAITGHSTETMFRTYVGADRMDAAKDFHQQEEKATLKVV